MARPTKLTKAIQKRICEAIRLGLTYEKAALSAGVSYDTLNRWRNRGEEDQAAGLSSEFCQFCEALEQAEAEGERANAEVVFIAAKGGAKVTETKTVIKRIALPGKGKSFDRFLEEVLGAPEEDQDDIAEYPSELLTVEETVTTTIREALPDWRAAAFLLERRHAEDWGRREAVEVSGPKGGPIQTEDVGLSDDERASRIAALLDTARARRDRQAVAGGSSSVEASTGATDTSLSE